MKCFSCNSGFAENSVVLQCPKTGCHYHSSCKSQYHDDFCEVCPSDGVPFKYSSGKLEPLESDFLEKFKSPQKTIEEPDNSNFIPSLVDEVTADYKNYCYLLEQRDHNQRQSSYYNQEQIRYSQLLVSQPNVFKRRIKLHPKRKNLIENDVDIAMVRGRFPLQSEALEIADWIEQYRIEGKLLDILSRVGY